MADSFVDRFTVVLADGVERDLEYPMGSLMWLRRKYGINLIKEMSSPGLVAPPEDASAEEKMAFEQAAMAAFQPKIQFIMENIDLIIQAGLMNTDASDTTIDVALVRKMPAIEVVKLSATVANAVMRGLSQKRQKAEGPPSPNAQ